MSTTERKTNVLRKPINREKVIDYHFRDGVRSAMRSGHQYGVLETLRAEFAKELDANTGELNPKYVAMLNEGVYFLERMKKFF